MSHTPSGLTVSVVICAYAEARWEALLTAVTSVQRQTRPAQEIIVIIDHNPSLRQRAAAALAGVTVAENLGNPGLSGARNSGIRLAHGEVVAFLDDDAQAHPDWLERLVEVYQHSHISGVGGWIEPVWTNGRPAWFPAEFDWVVGCSYRGLPEQAAPVRNLIGANMSLRRIVLEEVGGCRIGRVGQLSLGNEDDETDLCIRVRQQFPAAEIMFEPGARVGHSVPLSRVTLRYFLLRCYSEGLSKARLARAVGAKDGLSSERAYTRETLPRAVLRGLRDGLLRQELAGLLRAAAVVLGLGGAGVGFLAGQFGARPAKPAPLSPSVSV